MEDEEYELIPSSPIRKLEKRIQKMETSSSSSEVRNLIEQIIELIKTNQRVIDDVIKSNADLRNEISKLPVKIDHLLDSMSEFLGLLKASASEETVSEISKDVMSPVVERLEALIKQNKTSVETNQALLAGIDVMDKRLKRLSLELAGVGMHRPPSPR
jgi:hypothetical protein